MCLGMSNWILCHRLLIAYQETRTIVRDITRSSFPVVSDPFLFSVLLVAVREKQHVYRPSFQR